MNIIRHYTDQQQEDRTRLLVAIERERRVYEERIKPYLDQLIMIETTARYTYVLDAAEYRCPIIP